MAPNTVRFSEQMAVASISNSAESPRTTDSDTPSPLLAPAGNQSVDIHDLLKYRSPPKLTFDVSKNPETHPLLADSPSEEMLAEPATTPSYSSLILKSKHLTWGLDIHSKDPNDSHAYVSLHDLIWGLYGALRIPVTTEEWKSCSRKDDVEMAFQKRLNEVERDHGVEEAQMEREKGIKRVDFLQGNLKFFGLTLVDAEAGIFKFTVKK